MKERIKNMSIIKDRGNEWKKIKEGDKKNEVRNITKQNGKKSKKINKKTHKKKKISRKQRPKNETETNEHQDIESLEDSRAYHTFLTLNSAALSWPCPGGGGGGGGIRDPFPTRWEGE